MTLIVRDMQGNAQGELELTFPLSEGGKGSQAVHDAVVAHRAQQRSGTACTKTMGDVAGSGKKPWRQKGTGRARAGSFASPLWRGGGVVFGPKPRDFSKKVSKATRALALHKAISDRVRDGDVLVVNELKLGAAKTREMAGFLKAHHLATSTLIVAAAVDPKIVLASRNLPKVEVTTVGFLNTYQVLRHDKLVFSREALELLGQRLKTQ